MRISPKYNSTDWLSLNLKHESNSHHWGKAIQIFKDRYESRFINPIKELHENKNENIRIYSGFSIMVLNCILIETLQQFYYGKKDSDKICDDKRIDNIRNHKDCFVDFFNRSKSFDSFNTEMSNLFYSMIRNGLLHQAEIKKGSKINIKKNQKDIAIILNENMKNEGLSIRRDLFTVSLLTEYYKYISELEKTEHSIIRNNFITKMNLIVNDQN